MLKPRDEPQSVQRQLSVVFSDCIKLVRTYFQHVTHMDSTCLAPLREMRDNVTEG
jgi:hypothetical protein